MSEVYVGLYETDADGLPAPVAAERIHDQGAIAELENSNQLPWIPAGAGWERYPELLENNRRYLAEPAEARYPRAINLLQLGRRELLQHDALAPAQLEPAYLRKKVASAPAATS